MNGIDGVVISTERPERNIARPGWWGNFHLVRVARLEVGVKAPFPCDWKQFAKPFALTEPSETGEIKIGQTVNFLLGRVS